MGRYDQALADTDRAIELNTGDDWAIATRGAIYQRLGRYGQALADLDRAIELDPADDWPIAVRGWTYRQLGRYDQALADLDRAIELDPADDWLHYVRALANLTLGRKSDAKTDLRTATDLARTAIRLARAPSIDAYNLALYLAAGGELEQAKDQFVSALEDCPSTWWALEAIDDLNELANVPGVDPAEIQPLISLLENSSHQSPSEPIASEPADTRFTEEPANKQGS